MPSSSSKVNFSGLARMTVNSDASGAAALAICESLLLTLIDLKIISAHDLRGLLMDVVATHSAAALVAEVPDQDQAVVEIVKVMLASQPLQV
jgi:hypothetical protein